MMSITRIVYLLLAIVGLVMTWYYNLLFIAESGGTFDVAEFIAAGATNAAAQSLSWDLAFAFPLFLFFRQGKLEKA